MGEEAEAKPISASARAAELTRRVALRCGLSLVCSAAGLACARLSGDWCLLGLPCFFAAVWLLSGASADCRRGGVGEWESRTDGP